MNRLPEVTGFTEEVRRLFDEIEREDPLSSRTTLGIWTPPLDVVETDHEVELVLDVAGVPARSVRVVLRGASVLVAGEKLPPPEGPGATAFHLVERGFGRFARAVHIPGALDTSAARARLAGGELRVTIPKRAERRGQVIPVSVETT